MAREQLGGKRDRIAGRAALEAAGLSGSGAGLWAV
jgi:hypothetical protein